MVGEVDEEFVHGRIRLAPVVSSRGRSDEEGAETTTFHESKSAGSVSHWPLHDHEADEADPVPSYGLRYPL